MVSRLRRFRGLAIVACVAAAIALSGNAEATPVDNASVGGALLNPGYCGDGTGSPLGGGTQTATLATTSCLYFGGISITSLPANYTPAGGSSAANTFTVSPGNVLTFGSTATISGSVIVAGLGSSVTSVNLPDFMTFTGSTGTYDFNVTGLFLQSGRSIGTFNLGLLGTLTDTSGTYADTSAAAILQMNQTGGTGAITGSYTLGSPPSFTPPPSVPEPASMALFGVGLVGLGVVRRRKN